MSVQLQEGFDWLPGSNVLQELLAAGYYTRNPASLNFVQITGTAFGDGKAVRISQTAVSIRNGSGLIMPLDDDRTEVVAGFRIQIPSIHSYNDISNRPYAALWESIVSDTAQLSVSFDEYGIIRLWRGNATSGTLLATSKLGQFEVGRWFFIEIKALIAETGGYCEVRMNTDTIISVIDQDTQGGANANVNALFAGHYHVGFEDSYIYIDDLYVVDLDGTVNNDWLGNVRTRTLTVIADGDHIGMAIGGTVPAATNWQSVANTAIDGTKFVYGDAGDYDLYELNPALNSPLVHSIQLKGAMRMDDATQRTGNYRIKTNGTEFTNSETHYINQTFTFYQSRWEINPDTSIQFTGAEVNALQIGLLVG